MDFLFNSVKKDLIDTLDTLEQDINEQNKQINELIIDDKRKEKYITDEINVVKSILEKLNYEELSALHSIFYYMEEHFYLKNRTEEEEIEFIQNIAADINDLESAKFTFDDEEEDDWTDWNDEEEEDIN